uniref:Uncharacterized protein n=1 Tax=Cacopsylla melanoneura TaxID=428564 RepID=A0A8D8QGQ5_9HEMI
METTKLDLDWIKIPCEADPFDADSSEMSSSGSAASKQSALSISSSERRFNIQKIVKQGELALSTAMKVKNKLSQTDAALEAHQLSGQGFPRTVNWLTGARENLNKLKESTSESEKLKLAFDIMQQYAHGIEFIIQDQTALENSEFLEKFEEVKLSLRMLICETRWIMIGLGIYPLECKSPMTHIPVMRDSSFRVLEDWIIYSDYVDVLGVLVEELKNLSSSAERII